MKMVKRILSIIAITLTILFTPPIIAVIILLYVIIYYIDKEQLRQELRHSKQQEAQKGTK